jgi:hypothetical protein
MNQSQERFLKIVSIIGFFLILIVLTIVFRVKPASWYEFSIYDAYPFYFWALLLSAIFCGQVVIIGSAITHSTKNYWLFGLCAILIADTILLCIPIIRGYFIYGIGDVPTHIGFMKDILQTSGIGDDHYPIFHILGVSIQIFSNLSLPDITLILPIFFSFFFILSMFFLGKIIFQNKFEILIFVLLSSLLMWGNGQLAFVPNAQAFFLVPLLLYLALKMYHGKTTNKYHILLLLMSFLIVFSHPLVTIILILLLCLLQSMQYIQEKYEHVIVKKVNYTYAIFFIVAVFSIWSTYLQIATNVVEPIIFRLLGDTKLESEFQRNVNLISQVNIDPMYLLKLIFNIYGKTILLGVLSLFCIVIILISIKNQKIKPDFFKGISVMGFILLFLLSIAMLVSNSSFGFGRIYSFATFFSLLLIPTGIYLFILNDSNDRVLTKKKIMKLTGVIVIFFCLTYFSLFNLYLSPIIKSPNQQVPRSNYIGMSTFFAYRDASVPILEQMGPPSNRMYDALYGQSAPRQNIYFNNPDTIPPDHFGYQNATLSQNLFNTSKYLLVDDYGKGFYFHMYPEFESNWRFLAKDYERLKSDTNIQQVYSNKNLEIFLLSYRN